MSYVLAPAAILAFFASLPSAKAQRACEIDTFGVQRCYGRDTGYVTRLIIGGVLLGLVLIFTIIFIFLRMRRRRQVAPSAAFTGVPVMGYGQGQQGRGMGAAIPPMYDPNGPPPPFNGSWQNGGGRYGAGGFMNTPPQYPAPTYAPPAGMPPNEKETV